MLSKLKFLLFYYLGWLVFFECMRLLFVLYHFDKTGGIPFDNLLGSFWYGLRMDLSVAAYILAPVCLFVLLSLFIHFFRRLLVYRIYTFTVLLIVSLICLADLEMYNAWGFRIDAGPLKFLSTPKEALASVSHLPIFWILIVFIISYALLLFVFKWLLRYIFFQQQNKGYWLTGLVLLLLTASLIIPIRGGLQLAPLNQSAVYFSNHQFANHAAVNASWNFLHSLFSKSNIRKNPYRYMSEAGSNRILDSLYTASGQSAQWITSPDSSTVNVLLVIWESFTSKAVGIQYKGIEVTPRFNKLIQEGLYFDNLYASGDRTNKGVPAILSGYPAMNNTTIIHNPAKSAKLPSIPGDLFAKGYHTRFYYGGEPEFANIKSYLVHAGFNPIIGKEDFNKADMNSKWGAHDGVVVERMLKDFASIPQPFFSTWLTLSSHEPFETPFEPVIEGKDHTSQFLNSLHYTDQILGTFIDSCRKQQWWGNTVVIVIGDHGHPLPEASYMADNFRTPMLWLGGALQKKGYVFKQVASQLDLAKTLLHQLGTNADAYAYSKNLADSTAHSWAFFNFNDGFGWVNNAGSVIYDNIGKRIIQQKGNTDAYIIQAGLAMQQAVFQDFINK